MALNEVMTMRLTNGKHTFPHFSSQQTKGSDVKGGKKHETSKHLRFTKRSVKVRLCIKMNQPLHVIYAATFLCELVNMSHVIPAIDLVVL